MNNLVAIATYTKPRSAYFLKGKLEEEHINCCLDFISDLEKRINTIRLQVNAEDVEGAIQIMLRIQAEYGTDIENVGPTRDIRKIIVPTDFSENSENACYYAIHLAQRINAEIKLLHVYEKPTADVSIKKSATFEKYVKQTSREMEKKAKTGLIAFNQKVKDYMKSHQIEDIRIHCSTVMGNIIEKIKEVSNLYQPNLIVLGTVGKREASDSVLAGVADEIIRGLAIPVYAIPGPRAPKDFKKLNILYATDFNEKDNTSLDQLLKITEDLEKRVTCIHIDTAHNPAKQERMNELNVFLKKDYGQHDIQCRLIEDEDVYHGIKDFADRNDIHLISFTTQKRGIFEKLFKPNLFRKILQEANLPILIFPS